MDSLVTLLIFGAVNHQITHIITTSVLFEAPRRWVQRYCHVKLGYLVTCHLCCGTWIGFALAPFADLTLTSHMLVNFLLVAFAISCVGRLWNEALALCSTTVAGMRSTVG